STIFDRLSGAANTALRRKRHSWHMPSAHLNAALLNTSLAMSQEKRELLRPGLAEWAKGNLWVGAELMAPDITFRAPPPANFVAQGLAETARKLVALLAPWSDYRIEAEELEDLGEDSVLAVGRQHGTGKLSGAEVD